METITSKFQQINFDSLLETAKQFSIKLILATIVLIVGFLIVNQLTRMLNKMMAKRDLSKEIRPFLSSLFSTTFKVLILLSAVSIIGVETSSFVAILAAAGFAVGMALQGSLGNFAAGVLILIFKPYKVDDIIEIADTKGRVKEIQIFNTIIQTPTDEIVIVPNSIANSDKIINHSTINHVRVDVFAHIPYNEDFSKVERLILEAVKDNPFIYEKPATSVGIEEYDSHSIKFGVFAYGKPEDYYTIYYELTRLIKTVLGKNNIKVAYSEGVEMGDIATESKE
ncbi:MAG: mechanosensitive ion channel family protein [Bacteroidetes bacterium]|nr:mechanosensitive ion channel family protein [Bacteroidota bacterium]